MSGKLVVVLGGLAGIALVLVAVSTLYPSEDMQGGRQGVSADQGVEMFADRCSLNAIDHGALEMEHTKEQLYAACTCLGEDFRADLAGKTAEEISTFLDGASGNLRMRKSAIRCFRDAGIDFDAN